MISIMNIKPVIPNNEYHPNTKSWFCNCFALIHPNDVQYKSVRVPVRFDLSVNFLTNPWHLYPSSSYVLLMILNA